MKDLIENTFEDTTSYKGGYTSLQKLNIIHIFLDTGIYHSISDCGALSVKNNKIFNNYIESDAYSSLHKNNPHEFTERTPSPATILRIIKEFKTFLKKNNCSAEDICLENYSVLKIKNIPEDILATEECLKTEEYEIRTLSSKYLKDLENIKSKYIEKRSSDFLKTISEALVEGVSKDACHKAIFNIKEHLNL